MKPGSRAPKRRSGLVLRIVTMPRTLKLTIAYDGTNYAGWQRQANAHRHPAGPRRRDRGHRRRAPSAERGRAHRCRRARRGAGGEHHDRSSDSVRRTAARAQRAAEGRRHPHPRDRGDARSLGRAHLREDQRPIATRSGTARTPSPFLRHVVWHVPQPLDLDRMVARDDGARRRARFRRVPGPRQRRARRRCGACCRRKSSR